MRGAMDAGEYKHIALGLLFLRYVSEAFARRHDLIAEEGGDPEDRDEYLAENTFFVPPSARWSSLAAQSKDEAHRTQYGFEAKLNKETGEIRHGLAYQLRKALPNAVYVAFTGTPVELVGADTRGVFGDYIDVYDIAQAVSDGATVPIYYEARVAKITLDDEIAATLDDDFNEATEMLAEDQASATAKKWARVEALVGADKRLDTVVQDILTHFDARLEAMDGKAMIVCMSRRISNRRRG